MPRGEVADFIEELRNSRKGAEKAAHVRHFPAVEKSPAEPAAPLDPAIGRLLGKLGTGGLYSHQAEAVDLSRAGKNVLVSTHTSSGKTLIYNVLVFEALLKKPSDKALYVYPVKALARDQLKTAREFSAGLDSGIRAEVYDGDTPSSARSRIKREPPGILFTNPDMLHAGILAYHNSWAEFFKNLHYVVLDELHAYRGIFGCHVASVIRRLRRLAAHYGARPVFIASSATMANGAEFSRRLTGLDFAIVDKSGAPRGDKYFMFWDPGQSSTYTDASFLLEKSIENRLKTIVFTKSRKITELIYLWTVERNSHLKKRISAYRAGYLPEERRRIEKKLFDDELDAVIATSALELGIDVGGLDCCMLAGYPGSVISSWQRAGRAGRGDRASLTVMAALPDALDKYFIKHPDKFFDSGFESVIIDEKNAPVLKEHLLCAAAELPLSPADEKLFGPFAPRLRELSGEGRLLEGEDGRSWYSPLKYPHRNVSIRAIGESYAIIDSGTGRVMGDISSSRVFNECHPGAVYLHGGAEYEVEGLDLSKRCVYARKAFVEYYTRTTTSETVDIGITRSTRRVGPFLVSVGGVRVNSQVVSWEKRRSRDGALLGEYKLDLPARTIETSAVWLELPRAAASVRNLQGGLHAVEHAAIALFPLFALCDRWDIGGVSTVFHPQCRGPVIFMYDAYPGGVGLSEKAYEEVERLLESSLQLVKECACDDGCPSCIQSPKCGSRNEPLDKDCAVRILGGEVPGAKDAVRITGERGKPARPSVRGGVETENPRKADLKKCSEDMLFFDLETQKSAEEVGGWDNKRLMRVSVAVAYDEKESVYEVYNESTVNKLIDRILGAELVAGFNIKNFDMEVLSRYTGADFGKVKTLDILEEIYIAIGRRISLDALASGTLGEKKSGGGLDALQWFKENRMDLLVDYCMKDVELTRNLYFFGRKNKFLLFNNKKFGKMRISVDW